MKYDIIIVGSGITGATFAALSRGKKVLVLERSDLGGLCKTEDVNGIHVHSHGPHVFHTPHKYVWDFITQYATFNNYIHRIKSNVDGNIYPYPLNLETYNKLYSVETPLHADGLILDNEALNYEDYMMERVGPDLYDKFFKFYAEKRWGMKASNLPMQLGYEIPVRSSYNDNVFMWEYQGVPVDGYSALIENMLSEADVQYVDFLSDKVHFESLSEHIIYTGSVDEYFDYELGQLPYRTNAYYMSIEPTADKQGIAEVRYPDHDVIFTRTIEHKHFYPPTDKTATIITEEVPKRWTPSVPHPRMYPIPLQQNYDLYDEYCGMEHKAIFAGRIGSYHSMDMASCVMQAMDIHDNLI